MHQDHDVLTLMASESVRVVHAVRLAVCIVREILAVFAHFTRHPRVLVLGGSRLILIGVVLSLIWTTLTLAGAALALVTWFCLVILLSRHYGDRQSQSQQHGHCYFHDELLDRTFEWHAISLLKAY
jgi:hypothetical protein